MNIYLIEHDEHNYDAYLGHVIVADNEEDVIKLAKTASADEGNDVWDNAKIECCGKYTGDANHMFTLLSNFNAG